MNTRAAKLTRNASKVVILPIAGLLGGLFVGIIRSRGGGLDEIAQMERMLKWGIAGFFGGLALVVLLAFFSREQKSISTRKLIVLVVTAGLVAWFLARILGVIIGHDGF